jgi:8-oxo-dGTP pyrophosphatase MutT (NUDIX family)
MERARAVLPGFALTERNAPGISQLCRRLDAIPLALELAAARIPVLSVEEIAERLNDSLRLLTSGSRTAPGRQQTLRATLDWSYQLLSEPEQRLFERLSVFAGGWTLEAAEAVCIGTSIAARAVLDLLGGLVAKSLVLAQAQQASGPYRYQLLEVLRQYASERLAVQPEAAHVRQRHAEYFLGLRFENASERGGTRMRSWQVERDNANIATALGWSVKNGRARVRRSARVIVLDPLRRVLLFRNEEQEPSNPEQPEIKTYWFTPGGGAQPGESFEEAAVRELREETGVAGVALGPCVWSGQHASFLYGEPILADQRFFLVYTDNANVDTSDLHPDERSNWREFRWWTLAELHATAEWIWPEGLADLLEPLLHGHIPSSPIRIYGARDIQEAIAAASAVVEALADDPPGVTRSETSAGTAHSLTPREHQVATLVGQGLSTRQIAECA